MADSVKGFFGSKKQQDNAAERLERLQVRLRFYQCHLTTML